MKSSRIAIGAHSAFQAHNGYVVGLYFITQFSKSTAINLFDGFLYICSNFKFT